jgi:hypothetical protein
MVLSQHPGKHTGARKAHSGRNFLAWIPHNRRPFVAHVSAFPVWTLRFSYHIIVLALKEVDVFTAL